MLALGRPIMVGIRGVHTLCSHCRTPRSSACGGHFPVLHFGRIAFARRHLHPFAALTVRLPDLTKCLPLEGVPHFVCATSPGAREPQHGGFRARTSVFEPHFDAQRPGIVARFDAGRQFEQKVENQEVGRLAAQPTD
jgi:hypothetical protein